MRYCGACGALLADARATPALDADAIAGQRRWITAMFSDLVESTPIAELLDPEDFREVLTAYHAACSTAVQRFGGYVAQYQGDGVISYFGYPSAHEDDAARAVLAALATHDELDALNERFREPLDVSLQARIGIHTGPVIAGDSGRLEHERHTVVGDTLHVAARVQSLAKPRSVVVTDATLALLADQFETVPIGMEHLKGVSRPIALHSIVRPTGDERARTARARGGAPIIDRTAELAQLAHAWQRARSGKGVLAHVSGEAGIGKTRLVQALRDLLRGEAAAERVLQCSAHYSSTALHPVIHFLESLIDLDRGLSTSVQIETIESHVASLGLDPSDAVPLLADLLSIPHQVEASSEMTPRDARNALLRVLEALLVGNATAHPLLFVVEDVHWADPTTIELIQRIVAGLASNPAACVLTFRGDFEPPWTHWYDALEIKLGPLGPDDVRAIADAISPKALDSETLSKVESTADGVPLFVEEMVKAALAEGDSPEPLDGASRVPASLHSLLSERLDRLPALAGVIDVAAVLGREFERGIAERVVPLDRSAFRSAIAQLAAEDVLRTVEGARSRLEFRHALLQEAAYDRLLRSRRRALHRQVAEVLVAYEPSVQRFQPERIAHHLSSAGEQAEALDYWERAAQQALTRASFLEAAEHFRRSLEALDATRPAPDAELERADLRTHLGATLQAGYTPATDVEAVYEGARSSYERLGARERLVPVIRGQYLFHQSRAQYGAALELGGELLAMGREAGREAWIAEGHFYVGFTRMMRGELELARAELEDAVRIYRPTERSEQIFEAQNDPGVSALAYLSTLLWGQGHVDEAFARSEQSVELAEKVGGPVTLALAWGMRCALLVLSGTRAELDWWLEKTRAHSLERNVGYWSNVCSMWFAWLQTVVGDAAAGLLLLERQIDAYRDSGGRIGIASFYCLLAGAHVAAGGQGAALDVLGVAQEHIDRAGELYFEPEVQWLRGRVLMAGDTPDPASATAAYERAAIAAAAQDARLWELRAVTGVALLERAGGSASTATPRLEALCRWFGADSELQDVVKARALLEAAGRSLTA
jgi:class 3 adenylate cyclase